MKRNKKKTEKPVIIDQWIEITRQDGKTVTTRYPPNKELERLRQEMDPPAVLVYRRLNFVHGVPREYLWTDPSENAQTLGGMFLHRMAVEDWLHVLEQERVLQATGCGHLIPAETTQPRPSEFGPCPCARCTSKRERDQAD